MNNNRPTLLFITYLRAHFTELIKTAEFLQSNQKYQAIFIAMQTCNLQADDYKQLANNNIPIYEETDTHRFIKQNISINNLDVSNKTEDSTQALASNISGVTSKKIQMIINKYKQYSNPINKLLFNLFREIPICESFIRQLNPRIIIMAEDNVGYHTGIWVKIGHKLSIPVMIIPYTLANAIEPAQAVKDLTSHNASNGINRLIAYMFPQWVYEFKGKKLLRLPPGEIITQEWLGVASKIPWQINSSQNITVLAESQEVFNYFCKEGVSSKQLKITGTIHQDLLARKLKNFKSEKEKLYQLYNMDRAKPIILCALPPSQFPSQNCEFSNYRKLVECLVKTLSKYKNNVIINLHPRQKYEEMKYLENWGVKIVNKPIIEMIPLCDIYIACLSATIRWAIACGKPVINYDIYQYAYHDYDKTKGVITINNKADFKNTLNSLISNPNTFQKFLNLQKQSMKDWGILDGNCGNRLSSLIDQLISSSDFTP